MSENAEQRGIILPIKENSVNKIFQWLNIFIFELIIILFNILLIIMRHKDYVNVLNFPVEYIFIMLAGQSGELEACLKSDVLIYSPNQNPPLP